MASEDAYAPISNSTVTNQGQILFDVKAAGGAASGTAGQVVNH